MTRDDSRWPEHPDRLELADLPEEVARAAARAAAGRPVLVTEDGRAVAWLVGADGLRRLVAERRLLRRLALGDLEAAAGHGEDLEEVLDDALLLVEGS